MLLSAKTTKNHMPLVSLAQTSKTVENLALCIIVAKVERKQYVFVIVFLAKTSTILYMFIVSLAKTTRTICSLLYFLEHQQSVMVSYYEKLYFVYIL